MLTPMKQIATERYGEIENMVNTNYRSVQLRSVISQGNPGFIFVDSEVNPKTALVFHQGESGFFFVGDPGNSVFVSKFHKTLNGEINQLLSQLDIEEFEFSGDSPDWIPVFKRLFAGINLWESKQRIYIDILELSSRSAASSSWNYLPISLELFQSQDITNLDFVRSTILKWWGSIDNYTKHNLGYIALHNNSIIGRCLIDGFSKDLVAIGIEVEKEYQGNGIGTVLANKVIHQICESGRKPYWECLDSNMASRRVAEKCGLRLDSEYSIFGFRL